MNDIDRLHLQGAESDAVQAEVIIKESRTVPPFEVWQLAKAVQTLCACVRALDREVRQLKEKLGEQ